MTDPIRDPATRHPRWGLVALAALVAAALLIALVGHEVSEDQWGWDTAILLALRGGQAHGAPPGALPAIVVDVTTLGSGVVLTFVTGIAAGFLATLRRWLTMALVLAGTISGSLVVAGVKGLYARPRPQVTDHLVSVTHASFPSGHATNSAIVYLTLAALLTQVVEGAGPRRYIWSVAVLLVLAIGLSRLYLGVHWPSDVLAGWSFGAMWATVWWSLGAWLRARRAAGAMRRAEFDTL